MCIIFIIVIITNNCFFSLNLSKIFLKSVFNFCLIFHADPVSVSLCLPSRPTHDSTFGFD